jgi:hypothetical protein
LKLPVGRLGVDYPSRLVLCLSSAMANVARDAHHARPFPLGLDAHAVNPKGEVGE